MVGIHNPLSVCCCSLSKLAEDLKKKPQQSVSCRQMETSTATDVQRGRAWSIAAQKHDFRSCCSFGLWVQVIFLVCTLFIWLFLLISADESLILPR